jgi:hypothetical protein
MHRATETFHTGDRTITAGDLLEDDDPLVKAVEAYFEPAGDESKPAKKAPARRASAKTAKKEDA